MSEKKTLELEEKEYKPENLWCGIDQCRCEGSCQKKHSNGDGLVRCNEIISFYDANPSMKPKREFVRRGHD